MKFCKYHVWYIRMVTEIEKYGENMALLGVQAKSFRPEETKHAGLINEPEIFQSYRILDH